MYSSSWTKLSSNDCYGNNDNNIASNDDVVDNNIKSNNNDKDHSEINDDKIYIFEIVIDNRDFEIDSIAINVNDDCRRQHQFNNN